MTEEVMLDIGDLDNVIALLGAVYNDPRDALAEFVSNASDAKAQHIIIYLQRGKGDSVLRIFDDGHGMTEDELRFVARNIGNSVKRYDPATVGEKGIGILGFQAIAQKCDIVSRHESAPQTYCLSLQAGTRKATIAAETKRARSLVGTDVYLYGTDRDKLRMFTRDKLVAYFKAKFRIDLISGAYALALVEGKDKSDVRPDMYKGEPFYIDQRQTPYGPVRFELYLLPAAKAEDIEVYCMGKKVLNLTQLPEFMREPWTSNRVQGLITADFCKPNTNRTSFIRDSRKLPAWIRCLQSIEPELSAEIDRVARQYSQEESRKVFRRLVSAFQKTLPELQWEAFKGLVLSRSGELLAVDPVSGSGRGRTGKQKGKGGSGSGKSAGRGNGDSKKRAVPAFTFSWEEKPFEDTPHLRSQFDSDARVISINTVHPDYSKEIASNERKEAYFRILTSKELTLYNYPQGRPADMLENMIAVDVAVRRHL